MILRRILNTNSFLLNILYGHFWNRIALQNRHLLNYVVLLDIQHWTRTLSYYRWRFTAPPLPAIRMMFAPSSPPAANRKLSQRRHFIKLPVLKGLYHTETSRYTQTRQELRGYHVDHSLQLCEKCFSKVHDICFRGRKRSAGNLHWRPLF